MTSGVDVRSRMAALAERLTEAGVLDPSWRAAFDQVPRHRFIPDVVWHSEGKRFRAYSRDNDSEWWWNQVYADEFIVTQVDDGATVLGELSCALRHCATQRSGPPTIQAGDPHGPAVG